MKTLVLIDVQNDFLPGGALKLWAALAVYRYLLRRGLLPDQAA